MEKKSSSNSRRTYRTGGPAVNVPNAPDRPEERVNKNTGVPYDLEAGPTAQPEKNRSGLSEEGKLLATLQRRQKKIFGGPLARILSTRNANKVTQQLKDKSLTSAQKVAKEKSAQDYINKVNTFQSKLDTQVKNIIKSNNDNERNKKIKKLQDFVKQSDIFDTLEEDDTFYRRENWLRDYLKMHLKKLD